MRGCNRAPSCSSRKSKCGFALTGCSVRGRRNKSIYEMKIACPRCDFHPTPNILWQCRPGCGYKWHTFATHSVCPRCSKMWHDTQCPHCKLWSPIDDWYRDDMSERQPSVRRKQPETQKEMHVATVHACLEVGRRDG